MYGLVLQYLGFYRTQMAQIFTGDSCMPVRRIAFSLKLWRPYKGHVWAILGPCFGYFYNIFASRCLKWLKFSLESQACQIEENQSMLDYLDHIRAMFRPYQGHVWAILGPCFGYFCNIFAPRCLKWLIFSMESHASQIEENHLMWDYWNHIRAIFVPY